jgi:hypothetical protein
MISETPIKMEALMSLAAALEVKHHDTTNYIFEKLKELSNQTIIMRDIKNGYYGCRYESNFNMILYLTIS